jgi:hypothetical protein
MHPETWAIPLGAWLFMLFAGLAEEEDLRGGFVVGAMFAVPTLVVLVPLDLLGVY